MSSPLTSRLLCPCVQDDAHGSFVSERVEILLRQAAQFGLHTRVACVEYLGNLFRVAMDAPARKTDYQVGGCWMGREDGTEWVGRRVVHCGCWLAPEHFAAVPELRQALPACLAVWGPPVSLLATYNRALLGGCLPQIGEQLLRDLLFIHLDQPADKLQLTCQMLLKLFALVSGWVHGMVWSREVHLTGTPWPAFGCLSARSRQLLTLGTFPAHSPNFLI